MMFFSPGVYKFCPKNLCPDILFGCGGIQQRWFLSTSFSSGDERWIFISAFKKKQNKLLTHVLTTRSLSNPVEYQKRGSVCYATHTHTKHVESTFVLSATAVRSVGMGKAADGCHWQLMDATKQLMDATGKLV